MIAVDGRGENQIVVASGANLATAAAQVDDAWLGPDASVVLQREVRAEQSWAVARRARTRGARVILNAAPGGPVPAAVLEALDVLVMNEAEARDVAKALGLASTGPAETVRALAAAHGVTAIVTLGAAGAVAAWGTGLWRTGALPIAAVDTTGAGDAFTGVLAAALDRSAAPEVAFHRAAVAGGLACRIAGAQPSLPRAGEIDIWLARLPPPRRSD